MKRSYPQNLEQAVLLAGPAVFSDLIREAGGLSAAARIGETTRATLGRWSSSRPFARSFGGGARTMRPYQAVWFGYPPPLPGLDRVSEAIHGDDTGFICALAQRAENPVRTLALSESWGLDLLFTSAEIVHGIEEAGVPPSSARRWRNRLVWPSQLQVLDRLSLRLRERRWFHLVIEMPARQIIEMTPPGALSALTRHLAQQLRKGSGGR